MHGGGEKCCRRDKAEAVGRVGEVLTREACRVFPKTALGNVREEDILSEI